MRHVSLIWVIALLVLLPEKQVLAQVAAWNWASSLPGQTIARVAANPRWPGGYATGLLSGELVWGRDTLRCGCAGEGPPTSYLLRRSSQAAGNWAKALPGTSLDVAADHHGQVYVLGSFRPFAPADPNASPAYSTQVLCYDSLGGAKEQWNVPGQAVAFAVGPQGHVVVMHMLEPAGNNSGSKMQLTCFSSTGRQKWTRPVVDSAKNLNLSWDDGKRLLGVDRRGRVWLLVGFDGLINLKALQSTGHSGLLGRPEVDSVGQERNSPKPFTNLLLRYSSQGKLLRGCAIVTRSESCHEMMAAMVVAPDGALYTAGCFDNATVQRGNKDPQPLAGHGSSLLYLSAKGRPRWLRPLPYSATALALDGRAQPCVVASAMRGDSTSPALPTYQEANFEDVWVGHYSCHGQLLAGLHGGGGNDETATSMAVDGRGILLIAGEVRSRNQKPVPGRTRFGSVTFDTERDYGQDLHIVYDSTGQVYNASRLNPQDSPSPQQLKALHQKLGLNGSGDFYEMAGRGVYEITGLQLVVPLVADQRGNTYALAQLRDVLTKLQDEATRFGLGGGGEQVLDNPDYVLLKFEPNGYLLWAQRIELTTQRIKQPQLVADRLGNVFLAAVFKGRLVFDGQAIDNPTKQDKLLIVKCNSLGRVAWVRSGNVNPTEYRPLDVAPDGRGGLYATGTGTGDIRFDQWLLPARDRKKSLESGYLVAFDAAGKTRWLRGFYATGQRLVDCKLSKTPAGGPPTLVVNDYPEVASFPATQGWNTGSFLFFDTGTAGPARHALDTLSSARLVRYDAAGRLRWVHPIARPSIGSNGLWPTIRAAADARGNNYLAGVNQCALEVQNGQVVPVANCKKESGRQHNYLSCYDANGRARWVQELDKKYGVGSLAVSPSGICYLAGIYGEDETLSSAERQQIWVGAYGPTGISRWLAVSLGENHETYLGLSLDGQGRLHQTCQFLPVRPPDVAGRTSFGAVQLTGIVPVNSNDPTGEYELGITPFLATLCLPTKAQK